MSIPFVFLVLVLTAVLLAMCATYKKEIDEQTQALKDEFGEDALD